MGRGLVRLLVLAGATLIGAVVAHAQEGPLDPLTYTIHTVYGTPGGGQVITDVSAIQLVPVPIDVDHELTTGLAGADVLAQLTIDAGRATLRVTKLPFAPASMPLLIEAILRDPRGGLPVPLLGPPDEGLRVAFGYDALASTAPNLYDATLAIAGADRVTSFTLDLHTVAPGPTIGITTSTIVPATPGVYPPAPANLLFFEAGGPLTQVKGSYVGGFHTVGTAVGSNVDTADSGPYLPVANTDLVADSRIDFVGHVESLDQGGVCFLDFCVYVGVLIADGVTFWDTEDPSIPIIP